MCLVCDLIETCMILLESTFFYMKTNKVVMKSLISSSGKFKE